MTPAERKKALTGLAIATTIKGLKDYLGEFSKAVNDDDRIGKNVGTTGVNISWVHFQCVLIMKSFGRVS